MLVFIADAQFEGPPDIEQEMLGAAALVEASPASDLASVPDETWQRTDVLVCYHHLQVTPDLLERMPRCRLVVRAGVGFDSVDMDAAAARGLPVCNVPDYGTLEVADHSIAMVLTLLRGVATYSRLLWEGGQEAWDYRVGTTVRRLSQTTFGVLGLGRIGLAAAFRAKALGMDVVFFDPHLPAGVELSTGLRRAATLGALMAESDVLSIYTPLTPATARLVDAQAIGSMKRGAILVNAARGPIVDTGAVRDALLDGHLAAVALDVLPGEEDISADLLVRAWRADPRLRDRVLLSPHAAFFSPDSLIDLRRKSAEVVRDFVVEGTARNLVTVHPPGSAGLGRDHARGGQALLS